MKIRLEAFSPSQGIGIIRAGGILRLVRPPYTLHDSAVLSEDSLQDSILRYGFFASKEEFSNWKNVVDFLDREMVNWRASRGHQIPESISNKSIIEAAPEEILSQFLDRIEAELIPDGLFNQVENFLVALLGSKTVIRYPALASRAAALFERNKLAYQRITGDCSALASRDIRFSSLEKYEESEKSAKVAHIIRIRGSVFAPSS